MTYEVATPSIKGFLKLGIYPLSEDYHSKMKPQIATQFYRLLIEKLCEGESPSFIPSPTALYIPLNKVTHQMFALYEVEYTECLDTGKRSFIFNPVLDLILDLEIKGVKSPSKSNLKKLAEINALRRYHKDMEELDNQEILEESVPFMRPEDCLYLNHETFEKRDKNLTLYNLLDHQLAGRLNLEKFNKFEEEKNSNQAKTVCLKKKYLHQAPEMLTITLNRFDGIWKWGMFKQRKNDNFVRFEEKIDLTRFFIRKIFLKKVLTLKKRCFICLEELLFMLGLIWIKATMWLLLNITLCGLRLRIIR